MSQKYKLGDKCIYRGKDPTGRKCIVTGTSGTGTYTITFPDDRTKLPDIPESSLLTLEEAKKELSLLEVDKFYVYKGKDGNTPRLCKILGATDINIYTITGPGGTNDDQNPQSNVLVSDLLTYKMADKVFGDIRVDKELLILCRILERNKTNNTYTTTGRGGINDFQNPQKNVRNSNLWTIQVASVAWRTDAQNSLESGIYQWKNGIWLIGHIVERHSHNKTCTITGRWDSDIVPAKDLTSNGGLIVPESSFIKMEEAQRKFGDTRLYTPRPGLSGTEQPQKLHRIIERNWINKDYVFMVLSKIAGTTFEEKSFTWTYKITGSGGVNDFQNPITDVPADKNYDNDLGNDWPLTRGLWTFEQATRFSGGGNNRYRQGSLKHDDDAYEKAILTYPLHNRWARAGW